MGVDKKLILDTIDIAIAIGKRITLKKEGHNYVGKCPFHDEKSASFKVSAKKSIYKCFGCGRSGDVIKFVEDFDRVDFQEAIRRLAEEFNIVDPKAIDEQPVKAYDRPDPRDNDIDGPLRDYLMSERLLSFNTIRTMGITMSVEYMMKPKTTIPVICFNYIRGDDLINIKFRSINKDFMLVPRAELLPYNLNSLKDTDECSITEGEIDCATLVECGIFCATSAPNGANGNIDWVGSYYNYKKKVVLFMDDDDPGRKVRDKLIKRLGYHRCWTVEYPEGCKDINSVLQKHGPGAVRQVYQDAKPCPTPVLSLVTDGSEASLNIDPDKSMTLISVLSTGKLSYRIHVPGVLYWAKSIGLRRLKYADTEDSPDVIIRVVDNILYSMSDRDCLQEFVKEVDLNYAESDDQRNKLYSYSPSLTTVWDMLPYFDGHILSDTKTSAHLYFSNGVVTVTADSSYLTDYRDLEGYVWSKYIINHEYKESASAGSFESFLRAISFEADHYIGLLSGIGYLLHSYKLRTTAKAVVVVEDVDDESEARGRSGKGLIAQYLEIFKNTIQQDGRNYKADDKFKLQRVDISTQIFYLNDPAPGLLLSQFYNMITDDFFVEVKGKKSYTIPFKKSPKLLVTSNSLPVLESDSDRDRFHIMSIRKIFGATETISSRFPGVLFFDRDHWPENEFQAAYQLAIEAIQVWLTEGLVFYESAEMAANRAKRQISTQVPDYIRELLEQVRAIRLSTEREDVFNFEVKKVDLSQYHELVEQAFRWLPDGFDVVLTPFYRYCTIVLKAKTNQHWFGRRLKFYLEHAKMNFEVRDSSATGKKYKIFTNTKSADLFDQIPDK